MTLKTYLKDKALCIRVAVAVVMVSQTIAAMAEIIPATRRVTWQPGVSGGIPNRTTLFANATQAPYNADKTGAADAAAAIQNAINACPSNQVVFLPAGIYRLDSSLRMKDGVSLRGAGSRSSVLRYNGTDSTVIRFASGSYEWDFASSVSTPLSGGYTKGSTSLTMANNNWAVGDVLLVDELEDSDLFENDGNSGTCTWCGRANGERCHSQIVEVVTRTPTSVAIYPPLYSDYKSVSSPEAVRFRGMIRMAGIESLGITNVNGTARDTLVMEAGYKCWVKDCDLAVSMRRHTWMYHSIWCEFRDNSFHQGAGADWSSAYGPDRGYGIFLGQGSTSCLVENNDFNKLHFAVAFEGGCSGNVISYNFVTNVMYTEGETPQPAIGNHGAHPMMNLWEGNVLRSKVMMDSYWGSSSHTTIFRNRISNQPNNNGQQALQYVFIFDIWKNNRYHNIVGNVLGYVGMENAVDAPDGYPYGGKYIFRLGFTDANDNSYAGNDTTVAGTILRHGNWYSVTQSVAWDPAIADHTIPPSLYLASKPIWWGNLRWPAIGSDLSPTESLIPAQARFYGQVVVDSRPAPPANLRLAGP
jgi:hypothetical protein